MEYEFNKDFDYVISLITPNISTYINNISTNMKDKIQEIRLRADKPIVIIINNESYFLKNNSKLTMIYDDNCLKASSNDITESLNKMCGYSFHSHINDIQNGYLTLSNGARIGLCGTVVYENDKIKTMKDINSLNVRIPRTVKGVSNDIIKHYFKNGIENLLIAGSPSSGKTTILKDIAYKLSSGYAGKCYKVCVIDERDEICPQYNYCNSGPNTDVIHGVTKSQGIMMAVRTLSPDVVICDEIGDEKEIDNILYSLNTGVNFILTVHSKNLNELYRKNNIKRLIRNGKFENIVFLKGPSQPSEINEMIKLGDDTDENINNSYSSFNREFYYSIFNKTN